MVDPLHMLMRERLANFCPLLIWQLYRPRWLKSVASLLGSLTHTFVVLHAIGAVPRIDSFVTLRAARTNSFVLHATVLAVALAVRFAALIPPLHILFWAPVVALHILFWASIVTLGFLFWALIVTLHFLLVASSHLLIALSAPVARTHLAVGLLAWLHLGIGFTPLFAAASVLLGRRPLTAVLLGANALSLIVHAIGAARPALSHILCSAQARGSQQRSCRSRC
jgi:hypothetical protein